MRTGDILTSKNEVVDVDVLQEDEQSAFRSLNDRLASTVQRSVHGNRKTALSIQFRQEFIQLRIILRSDRLSAAGPVGVLERNESITKPRFDQVPKAHVRAGLRPVEELAHAVGLDDWRYRSPALAALDFVQPVLDLGPKRRG